MITEITYKIEKGRIYAEITRDEIIEGETITIKPSTHSDTTYTKYLPNEGLVVDIDLTPYCESMITGTIRSIYDVASAGDVCYGEDYHLSTYPQVSGLLSSIVYYPNCQYSRYSEILLTRLPYLQVSCTADLFLATSVLDDSHLHLSCGDCKLEVPTYAEGEAVRYIVLPMDNYPQELVVVGGTDGTRRVLPIRWVPQGMNTRRLVWLNEVGGIDSWSFEFLRESSFATSSEVFYSATKGYTRTNRISERAHIIETRELDDITASVVAYVIASPEVYLEENGKLTPIDIVTEECRTYSDTELSSIQVAYRLKERETL